MDGENAFSTFNGHYDVVPAQSREQFQPLRKDHFLIWPRLLRHEGGIVAMLYAILALRECGAELHGRIALTLVPNEETGGEAGSAWLAAQRRLGRGGIGCFLAEPNQRRRLEREPWRDFVARPGAGEIRTRWFAAPGRECVRTHASRR